jgi:hypothetical protein
LKILPLDEKHRLEWINRITAQHTEWEKEILGDLQNVKHRDDVCPICTEKIVDPILCSNRHAFCRACIERWRRGCPVCKEQWLWDMNFLSGSDPTLYQWK